MSVRAPAHRARLGHVGGRVAALSRRGSEVLAVVIVGAVAIGLLRGLRGSISTDTWLGFIAGRVVADDGIPRHETLTLFAHGGPWLDQQWLAQLVMYEVDRIGGIGLTGIVNVALISSGLLGAAFASVRLGASAASAVRALPLAALCALTNSAPRTQSYAYPLFVAVVYLLAQDGRRGSRRVYWCLPILVVWANLHGSASLGAGLVGLRALAILGERRARLREGLRPWRRPLVLGLGAAACLLVTPYGISIVSYYHDTVLNPAFSSYVTEWLPVTSDTLIALPFFVLAAIMLWSFGRHAGQTTLWERLAMLVMGAGAIIAVRNVVWFGLAAGIVLPLSIDGAVRRRPQVPTRARLNLALLATVGLVLLVSLAQAAGDGAGSLTSSYPAGAAAAVSSVTRGRPAVDVFSDETYADWLLDREPQLAGRMAYDARFELLTARQLSRIVALKTVIGTDFKRAASGYRVLVLDAHASGRAVAAFEREPGARVVYDRHGIAVILRSAIAAGARPGRGR